MPKLLPCILSLERRVIVGENESIKLGGMNLHALLEASSHNCGERETTNRNKASVMFVCLEK